MIRSEVWTMSLILIYWNVFQAGRIVDQFVIIKDQRKDVRQWSDRSESLSLDDKDFYQLIDN